MVSLMMEQYLILAVQVMDNFRQGHAEKEDNDEALHAIGKLQPVQRTLTALLSDLLTILEVGHYHYRVAVMDAAMNTLLIPLAIHLAYRFLGCRNEKEPRSYRTAARPVSGGWASTRSRTRHPWSTASCM
jgi:hypothetical protein